MQVFISKQMDIVNRLKLFMDINKIAISQFADTCNIPRPTMSQILNGRNKKISDELISKIHIAYPHLSVLWLMFGEGEMMQIANMPSSMPQTDGKNGSEYPQITDNKQHSLLEMPDFAISENEFKKNPGTEITSEALNHELRPVQTATPEASSSVSNTADNLGTPNYGIIDFEEPSSSGIYKNQQGNNPSDQDAPNTDTEHISPMPSDTNMKSQQKDELSSDNCSPTNDLTDSRQNISLETFSGKRITNIVVFYSDNSFQSFYPELGQPKAN